MLFNTVVLLAILAVLCAIVVDAADISGFWSEKDIIRVQQRVKTIAQNSHDNREIYHALQLSKKYGDLKGFCACDSILAASSSANTNLDWYFISANSDDCGCSVSVPTDVLESLHINLTSDSLIDIAGSILLGQYHKRLSNEAVENGLQQLRHILTVGGEVKLDIENVHLVLKTLAAVYSDNNAAAIVSEVYESAFHLLPTGNGDALSDPTILGSLSKLSDKKVKLSSSQMQATADALIPLKYSDDAETLFRAYESVFKLTSYKSAPLYVTHHSGVLKAGEFENHNLEVEVFDLLGNSVPVVEIEILSLKCSGKDTLFAEGVKISGNSITLSNQKLGSGRYIVNLSVTVSTKTNPIKYQGYFTVVENISIVRVHAGVSDNRVASPAELSAVSAPNGFAGFSASAVALDSVHITYAISPAQVGGEKMKKPHQSFVRFTNLNSGVSTVFPSKRSGDGPEYEYTSSIILAEEVDSFNYASAAYSISILVGDATFALPLEWIVGSIDLKFPSKPVVNLPLYAKSLLHTSDNTLQALPQIEHQMRPPAQRASDFMAGTFTLLTLVPLVVFIGFNVSLKPNIAYLKSPISIAFVLCLAGTLLLYSGYWLAIEGLSFYRTIKYLGFSFPVTLFLGYYSLQSVMKVREEKQK